MAKGQKRSNRELKKPKKKTDLAPPAGKLDKGMATLIGHGKKKA